MTSEQASRIVLLSGAGMATFVLIQANREKRPSERTFKSLWAIGLVTLGLAIFADFVPEVAGPFALLVLIAMAVRNTGALGGVIGGVGRPAQPQPAPGPGGKAGGGGGRNPRKR